MKILCALAILLSFSFSSAGEKKKNVVYRKSQDVNFEEASIDGEVSSPDGAFLHQKRGLKFLPLYNVQQTFDEQIKESVEYLR